MPEAQAEETHRFFSPSASERWFVEGCTASLVVDTSDLPERTRADADRGTRLHAVGEKALRSGSKLPDDLDDADFAVVSPYVDFVRQREGAKLYEFKADLVLGLCGGTADCVVVHPGGRVLEIIDFKSGTWPVRAEENPQLSIYWLAVHDALKLAGPFEEAWLTVVQPAIDNFDTWKTTPEKLLALGDEVLDVVDAVMSGEVEFKPSDDGCKFCDARPVCPALENAAERALADFAEVIGEDPGFAGPVADMSWSERLDLVEQLARYVKAVTETGKAMVLRGDDVPGWKAVAGRRGNRSWDDMRGAVDLLTSWDFDERDIYTDPAMRSPAQIEKLVKEKAGADKKLAKERIAELADHVKLGEEGAPTVVRGDDKREAIDRDDLARRDFAGIIEGEGE